MLTRRVLAAFCAVIGCAASPVSVAAYGYMGGIGPLYISAIYQNEYGSAFVYFTTPIDPECGGGMYLMNLQQAESSLQKYKMAIAISAVASGKRVNIDYFKDATRPMGWDRCFIHGITILAN